MAETVHEICERICERACGLDGESYRRDADSIKAAHKREIDALKQRCTELNAEVAAKDDVIKRLNDALVEEQKRSGRYGNVAKLHKTVDLRFEICSHIEQVLKIGRDYQNKDGYRGAHYDTVKLLCDAIEYQQEQLETKTKVGDAAKLREALSKSCAYFAVVLNTGMFNRVHLEALLNMAKAALAAPARNSDALPPEKLLWAFNNFHQRYFRADGRCGIGCPLRKCSDSKIDCALRWMQLAYEEPKHDYTK